MQIFEFFIYTDNEVSEIDKVISEFWDFIKIQATLEKGFVLDLKLKSPYVQWHGHFWPGTRSSAQAGFGMN